MRNFSLAQQEIANHSLAIDRIRNRLPDMNVIKRRLAAIKSQQIEIRAGELKYLQLWMLPELFDGIGRQAGGQWRYVHAPGLKLGLQGVRVGNDSDAHHWNVSQ